MPKIPEETIAQGPFRVVLAGIRGSGPEEHKRWEESCSELARLCETLEYQVSGTMVQERSAPDGATYLGRGKAQELALLVDSEMAKSVIVDGRLTSSQAHNLSDVVGVPVIDRIELILRIFASRAKSKEGKLQVESASLRHALSRLSGFGVEMSNPGAGVGTRGPGETKIETDRRTIRRRMATLNRQLDRVRRVREEQKKRRKGSGIPIVSLVGYTNVGKSTLFGALTGEAAFADDLLFATLDPWTRKWELPNMQAALLVDTVGFIQNLPHELIAAFRATLEESMDSDVLVHVVDVSNPAWRKQMEAVNGVLEDLGAGERPKIVCFNKIDTVDPLELLSALQLHEGAVAVSAIRKEGLVELGASVIEALAAERVTTTLHVPYSKWDLLFELRKVGNVQSEVHDDEGATLVIDLLAPDVSRYAGLLRDK